MNESYFDTLQAAMREAEVRRGGSFKEHITKVRRGRYGGFVVVSIPVDIFVDLVDLSHEEGGEGLRNLVRQDAYSFG